MLVYTKQERNSLMLDKNDDKRTAQGHILRRNQSAKVTEGNAKVLTPVRYPNDNEKYADR